MASRGTASTPYFFIFDFYLMKDSKESNDLFPKAITYYFPTTQQLTHEQQLKCGEIVGAVQYFQNDLFRSVARTLYFQNAYIVHQHYGRHSAFLHVPEGHYTTEEAHVCLKHILNLFNMLFGTWNHVQSIYGADNKIYDFLKQALTPIVNYVLSRHRSVSTLFSTIEYTLLKNDSQRVLLESEHYLGYLKSQYGLHDGYIGYDDKILYSTCDPDTTFYLQLFYQLKHEFLENLITIPWESKSEFKLRNGVSLFRIFMRQPSIPNPTNKIPATPTTVTATTITSRPIFRKPIHIFDRLSASDDSSSPSLLDPFHKFRIPSPTTPKNRSGIYFTDQSGSSEETGFETDTMDELSPHNNNDAMTNSSISLGKNLSDLNTEDSDSSSSNTKALTDEQKLEQKQSRSSTMSDENEFERTIKTERKNSSEESVHRIHLTQIDSFDTSDDEENSHNTNQRSSESSRGRATTIIDNSDSDTSEFLRNDRNEIKVTGANTPEKNTEHERDELVLYVQRNSGMTFAGIIEQSLLTNDYLKKLWNFTLTRMASMEAAIQVIPTANDNFKIATGVKFEFNENTHLAEFERIFDGVRYTRRIPSEDSAHMAFFARTELNRNPERKVIGLSRGSHLVSVDRHLPDRIKYTCGRFQETS